MQIMKIRIILFLVIMVMFFFIPENIYSADSANVKPFAIPYKLIEISALSRYNEDRIVFQHIQLSGFSRDEDNSIATLVIIKNNEVYLFRDGFDDIKKIAFQNYLQVVRNEVPGDLWINKIDSKPDFVRIATRRTEKLLNNNADYTEKSSGDMYRSIRDSLLSYHVRVFRELMRNRFDSDFKIQRNPIYPPSFKEMNLTTVKFSTIIKARAPQNNYLYYAEDTDGDEVTDTFYVTLSDGFNWGYKSGPNIVFIYNNNKEDIKQIIGKLCYEAYFGTLEEEVNITKVFPKESDILNEFKLEKAVQKSTQPDRQSAPVSEKK